MKSKLLSALVVICLQFVPVQASEICYYVPDVLNVILFNKTTNMESFHRARYDALTRSFIMNWTPFDYGTYTVQPDLEAMEVLLKDGWQKVTIMKRRIELTDIHDYWLKQSDDTKTTINFVTYAKWCRGEI